MRIDPAAISVDASMPIREAMECLNNSAKGIVLVVDGERRLLGTATDGDIRRALLRGAVLDSPVREAMKENPVVVPENLSAVDLAGLMKANSIRQLPIVDGQGRVLGSSDAAGAAVAVSLPLGVCRVGV